MRGYCAAVLLGCAALAAATGAPQLRLQPLPPGHAELELCFPDLGGPLRFELEVDATGAAGTTRSRQRGELPAGQPGCPLRNRLSAAPGTRIDALLRWWVGDAAPQALSTSLDL
ncbi:hypothetical protein [Pseudomonas sp. UBA6310]|uniref:hypothetical protein n=1 Tax=Pseudomonas sp. UBA6310 TaxID=1947327 RepID=UPI00257DA911|nr:hypothetical protein [Pseudomonas sp. UBA6310]